MPVHVERLRRDGNARHAAEDEEEQEPEEVEHRRVEVRPRPCSIVATQVKTLMAEKMATNIESTPNMPASNSLMPATNMWWPQVQKPTNAMPSDDIGDGGVRGGRLARERAHHLADHAHRRQDHDVDRRVRVEPEEVLEEHRIAAQRRDRRCRSGRRGRRPPAPSRGRAPAWRGA